MRGLSFIAGQHGSVGGAEFHGINPATGDVLAPTYHEASANELDQSCKSAWKAFESYRELPDSTRAGFLNATAEAIQSSDEIVNRGVLETGLTRGRLETERARTCNQLRSFASLIGTGDWVGARIEHAAPDRQPAPKPDLRCMRRPIGPVAVFCASNFPLAFSVAGGDTASALAAGCPVVVKAHHAHPGVAELVAETIVAAVRSCGMPQGVFSMLYGAGTSLGQQLVRHPSIKAVGFTGSRAGGRALMDIAASRPDPITVYAEMSSTNPVIILPDAVRECGRSIAEGLHASVTLGVGQFCTNPGLVFIPTGDMSQEFRKTLIKLMQDTPSSPMLHCGIRDAYFAAIGRTKDHSQVRTLFWGNADAGAGHCNATPALFETSVDAFLNDPELAHEIFGPSTLLVTYSNTDELRAAIDQLEGQLTATIHGTDVEIGKAADLMSALEQKVGRILFGGFPTGVDVCHAMVHGGPYPATSDGRSTSVGSLAIERFTRLVAWQNCPDVLLPAALQDANPLGIRRMIDGQLKG